MRLSTDLDALARNTADILARLRSRAPRVHCITNSVAQNFTANVLLAAGAVPSMTIAREEIGHFTTGADALLVNLGTFDRERGEAIQIAITAAAKDRRPWVLDSVLIERSPPRAALARDLVKRGPSAIRLNAGEFRALSGGEAEAVDVARFAGATNTVVAMSGKADLIADGTRSVSLGNGHALMARVTAMGCAASALVAACLAVEDDVWQASAAGLLMLGIAGERAGAKAAGPGSFAVTILDELYRLDAATLTAMARVS